MRTIGADVSTELLLSNQIFSSHVLTIIFISAQCEKVCISYKFILHYTANALAYHGAYPLVVTIRISSYRAGFCFQFYFVNILCSQYHSSFIKLKFGVIYLVIDIMQNYELLKVNRCI